MVSTRSPSSCSPEANHSHSQINSLRPIERDSPLTSYTFHTRRTVISLIARLKHFLQGEFSSLGRSRGPRVPERSLGVVTGPPSPRRRRLRRWAAAQQHFLSQRKLSGGKRPPCHSSPRDQEDLSPVLTWLSGSRCWRHKCLGLSSQQCCVLGPFQL